ncbi:MAG: catalase family protein [Actinomycetota bacterium]|nr:catalase family protein [Actinomycetota bacterium]
MTPGRRVHDLLLGLVRLERRIDPYFRPAFERYLRPWLAALVQRAINARRTDPHLGLAEERPMPREDQITAEITDVLARFLRRTYAGTRPVLRAGNTKTYGLVRGEFTVLPDLPPHLCHGLFSSPESYRAWVRFAGPGPLAPPDLDDNGILSIGIKVMGVPGPKLLDDERWTQDFTALTAPTFTTPDVVENLKLQRLNFEGVPLFYFVGWRDGHYLDALMQALYAKTPRNPLEERYWSDVAYLMGEGQAMHYTVVPRSQERSPFPRRPSTDYLREAMVTTLRQQAVDFDFMVQLQTDPFLMPIEDGSVDWPERLSPFVPVARLHLPAQEFDSRGQLAFAENLSFNPWHSLPEHRPLGNLNRARRTMYLELSRLRQGMNGIPHVEPTGDEKFDA